MKNKIWLVTSLIAVAALFLMVACTAEEKTEAVETQAEVEPVEISESAVVTGTVAAVDLEGRSVTLTGVDGGQFTMYADHQVKRLHEIEIGDQITAEYYVSMVSELREPTPEERANPLVETEGQLRGPATQAPWGTSSRDIRAVVEVVAIDTVNEMGTIKGPRGRTFDIHAKDPARLRMVSVGDTVVITYSELLAISLQKAE
jgi:hypothetical protein